MIAAKEGALMFLESDATYFGRRANEELFAASKAEHPNARLAHLELAARYDDLARGLRAHEHLLFANTTNELSPVPETLRENCRVGIWL
jgi:hypothetical protein